MLSSRTVGPPGTHGAGVLGMHGMGVSTPIAAAVAAATMGFGTEVHMPKSMMLASGTMLVMVRCTGSTTSELGASPKLHCIIAPMHTCIGIASPSRRNRSSLYRQGEETARLESGPLVLLG